MVTETKESHDYPDEIKNLREFITAYDALLCKTRTTKNNIIRVLDMLFPGLSNIIDIERNLNAMELYSTPEDYLSAGVGDLSEHMTRRKAERIVRAAENSPAPGVIRHSLEIEKGSLIRILKILDEEKKLIEKHLTEEMSSHDHVIKSIPGVGPITGSIILGKIGDISRFENAEKLVAFAGIDPVIKESGKHRSQRAISKRGDPLLRNAIYMSTLSAVRSNPAISDFYKRKVDGGMPKQKALVAASRKQCHVIWSVWYNNRPFQVPEKFRSNME